MTPHQKAKELLSKLFPYTDGWVSRKTVALMMVDEIILSAPFEPADTDWDEAGASAQYWYPQKLEDSAKWWGEVKQEILNL